MIYRGLDGWGEGGGGGGGGGGEGGDDPDFLVVQGASTATKHLLHDAKDHLRPSEKSYFHGDLFVCAPQGKLTETCNIRVYILNAFDQSD